MSLALDRLPSLFGLPGTTPTNSKKLLHQVASVHAGLLTRSITSAPGWQNPTASCLMKFLDGPSPTATKRRLLCHPLFIETLHTLATHFPQLDHWHQCVTSSNHPHVHAIPDQPAALLGNIALTILLHSDPEWQGELLLSTDVLGRIGFPFSDWSISVCEGQNDFLSSRVIRFQLDGFQASWRIEEDDIPFLILPRSECLQMIVENSELIDSKTLGFPHPALKPQLRYARKLGLSPIRYDPVGFLNYEAHAGLTGGIIQRLLAAIQCNSPAIYRELGSFIHSIRGYEFPPSALGIFGSFSDPTSPGVMSVNISYTPDHQPCLDPFCFTWFGHEMGHSKNYLIDTVLYGEGISLVLNSADRTDVIVRYGRAFTIRTLFQIPYVHLYEFALLMDFWQADFRGLPWSIPLDPQALGDDIALEIEEAFTLIDRYAHLSPWGQSALDYFHELFDQAKSRWIGLRHRLGLKSAALAKK